MEQQTISAKLGAKLDYIMQLNGKCPEGTEKYLSGGCIKCKKKAQGSTIDLIKDQMKCGGKMKKRISKKSNGSSIRKLGPGDSTSVGSVKLNKKQQKAMK